MQRLIAKQKANGSAVFRECVQAMAPFLQDWSGRKLLCLYLPQRPQQQVVPAPQGTNRSQGRDTESLKNKIKLQKVMEIFLLSGAPVTGS